MDRNLSSLFSSLSTKSNSSTSPQANQARDDLDTFLGLPSLPIRIGDTTTEESDEDIKPEVIDNNLVCPKAKLIATLITPDNMTSAKDPYYFIQDYINFSQSPKFGMKILKVCRLTQCAETQDWSYQNVTTNSNRMMLWHGTKMNKVRGILENGFLKPSSLGHQRFGPGIYFADRVAKSSLYCSSRAYVCKPTEGEIGFMFLCEVQMGRIFETRAQVQNFLGPPKQWELESNSGKDNGNTKGIRNEETGDFDSVKYAGKMRPDSKGDREVNGIIWPLGITINGDSGGDGEDDVEFKPGASNIGAFSYNEYIVYDPSKIKMKYLVKVEFTKEPIFNIYSK